MKCTCPHCGHKFEQKAPRKSKDKKFDQDTKQYQLAFHLRECILKTNSNARVPKDLEKWAKQMDSIMRLDDRDPREMWKVISFAHKNDFWKGNILSPTSLRKSYDKLVIQMGTSKSVKPSNKKNAFNNYNQRQYDYDDIERKALEMRLKESRKDS